ncbi:DUF488 family protein, N3 subclade [Alloscardovia macacae]|uniref:DUF488 family protein, N3 subclade n=1 Tax=Alloscardovia macacae TaxID=1160091 RepID=UPI001178C94C
MIADIALKRAYEPARPEVDGYRILVDRLWPRGVSKEKAALDEWDKATAPSLELRTWWGHDPARYADFAERYRAELDENPEVQHLVELVRGADGAVEPDADGACSRAGADGVESGAVRASGEPAPHARVTLVYGAKDAVFNHAHVLRNYLIETLVPKTHTILNSNGYEIATIPARVGRATDGEARAERATGAGAAGVAPATMGGTRQQQPQEQRSEEDQRKQQKQSPKAPDLTGLTLHRLTPDDAKQLQWVSARTFEDTFLLTSEPRDNDEFIAEAFTLEEITRQLRDERMLHFALVEDATGEIAAFTKLNLEGAQTEGGGSTLGPTGVDAHAEDASNADAARDAKNSAAHSAVDSPAHSTAIPQNSLEIHRLYVTSRFKRRGLGSYLMQLAHDTAREQGCGWLWLGVWQYNFAAQQFYAGWGFERFSEHTFVVGSDPQVDFLLKKRLA